MFTREEQLCQAVLSYADRLDEIANKESNGKIEIQRIARGLRDMVRRQMSAMEAIEDESQGVDPIIDPSSLAGTWPGGDDDGFEDSIDKLRHPER